MEYLYYALSVLAIVAVCLYAMRMPGRQRLAGRPVELAERARRRRERKEAEARRSADLLRQHKQVLQRELQSVPTPWGWPGNELRSAEDDWEDAFASPFQRWLDSLMREKRTVDSAEYLAHRQDCLRALLEDRFGRSTRPSEIPYDKVTPPRLKDPATPYDQQDNFPGGKTDQIVAKLARQPGSPKVSRSRTRPSTPLREIRKPWGW